MINFNKPITLENHLNFLSKVIESNKMCGDGNFTHMCNEKLEDLTGSQKVLLTTSCTHALEMAALLCDIEPDDEVIMPSYTFVSTANAFVQRGAKIVFVDVRPDTMNINEKLIEAAVSNKTKAIVPVHYAGVGCEMDFINEIAKKYNLTIIEDAAQGVNAFYNGKSLGSLGDLGCFSFHETKNYSMGEGGALLINNSQYNNNAEIIREKGTNRKAFIDGLVDKYTWVDYGSSYLPSEFNAAYLYPQLEKIDVINDNRLATWNFYNNSLKDLENKERIVLPYIPDNCVNNAHMFYIKTKDLTERSSLIEYLRNNGVASAFHYIPLHSSPAGKKFGVFVGDDIYTTQESERLLRLPMYYGLTTEDAFKVVQLIYDFYKKG